MWLLTVLDFIAKLDERSVEHDRGRTQPRSKEVLVDRILPACYDGVDIPRIFSALAQHGFIEVLSESLRRSFRCGRGLLGRPATKTIDSTDLRLNCEKRKGAVQKQDKSRAMRDGRDWEGLSASGAREAIVWTHITIANCPEFASFD